MAWLVRLWTRFIHWLGFGSSDSDSPTVASHSTQPTTSPSPETELALAADQPPQYKQKDSVFTYQERRFFLANEPKDRKYHNNQIQCKHIDYLLCEKFGYKPVLAIELDDSSHKRFERQMSDEFKSVLLEGIGLPLLRFKIQPSYDSADLAEIIAKRLKLSSSPSETL